MSHKSRHPLRTEKKTVQAKASRPAQSSLAVWKKMLFAVVACAGVLLLLELALALIGVKPIRFERDPYVGFTSQLPLFRLLGPPADRKAHATFEGGHLPFRFNDVIRTILDWFDKYLGPVRA